MYSKTPVFILMASLLISSGGAWAQTSTSAFNLPHDPPIINVAQAQKVADGITVIPDNRINYVPNIGIIEGKDAILVIDTGLGKENGDKVFTYAKTIAGPRKIYVTTTHFHPEHSFGVSEFKDAIFVVNRKQAQEIAEKGQPYLAMFRNFGAVEKQALKDTVIGRPSVIYEKSMTLDLGDKQVQLLEMPAHTQGDQVVYVDGVVFLGDLVENRFYPIMPDRDSNGEQWIKVLDDVLALKPAISVPGHGALGDANLIKQVRDYLVNVRDQVSAAVRAGKTQEQTIEMLSPKLKALHPDWDNSVFIPYEISVFYAEISGEQLKLPDLLLDMQK
ncbi:MBL fold metallo-hydrolase [Pseudomonas edaphica]|uniref:MBL fold metallo-hydrolase n=1 Tax=Pseudomonas edaphica TaxID=2006980 RepID=A0ABY2U8I0_9PSED|nr:MBL fold metallo-hydrolase [Pseudomonas edaphica]TLG91254.1 MBL fold metallo-hydrolase [Pseudomonas edaphica]